MPSNTKTMLRDVFSVRVHAIAEKANTSVGVYDLVQRLQEALTIDIFLPEPFELVLQTDNGVQTVKKDDTGEKHAIIDCEFMVCYGLICKL